ncbi:uncharacterized protein METZ01_LOCUS186778 [marine metagenome]|uniref:Uncharacterized protein n=1 Tax=marine metagenome TaxID=408172 RepID=A0A382D798_9ZZZZ
MSDPLVPASLEIQAFKHEIPKFTHSVLHSLCAVKFEIYSKARGFTASVCL